jgi:uncharacterized protein YdhG (YjbR/CyaY superfamily)
MKSDNPNKPVTVDEYLERVPDHFAPAMNQLRKIINQNLPQGFSEELSYGMPGWVVPHSTYPAGYHCDPSIPLPFISLAAQSKHISLYHMGMYANPSMLEWFKEEFKTITGKDPDVGKSCIRFKKTDKIPFELIGELVSKLSPEQWIELYVRILQRK